MKFSIRDLLLMTMIVALAVAWWVDRSRLAQVIEVQNVELQALQVQEEVARAVAEAQAAAAQSALRSLPRSSPLAPNPPKP